jgi:hypothetical protein
LKDCHDNIKKLKEQRTIIDNKLEDINKEQNEIREKRQYIESKIRDILWSNDCKINNIKDYESLITRNKEKHDRYAELYKT